MNMNKPTSTSTLEYNLRNMHPRDLVLGLMDTVKKHRRPVEMPMSVRGWLELDRTGKVPEGDAKAQMAKIQADLEKDGIKEPLKGWFEFAPVSGWVLSAAHFLKDGKRWWLMTAKRHADSAPLVGPRVPAPASLADLRRLGKLITYAGGDPNAQLLRTGAITKVEHDDFIARGLDEIAEYGEIFYWWPAAA